MRRSKELIEFSGKLAVLKKLRTYEDVNQQLKLNLFRILNDYEGFKRAMNIKMMQRERDVKEKFVRELIPLLEDMDRLLNHISLLDLPEDAKRNLESISKKVEHSLRNLGIEKVVPSEGDDFDPETCEALTVIHREDIPKGKIAAVFEPAWKFEGKIIKPARVGVSG